MKTSILLLVLTATCLVPLSARADFHVQLDAGELTGPPTAPMQADNVASPYLNGSLLLLLDLGSSNAVSNSLTAGNFASGTNFVIAAGGFNTQGGTNETLTSFTGNGATAGDEIALRWFPQLTFAQYNANAVTSAGQFFGTYSPNGGSPDGADNWIVPSGGTITLDFYTSGSDGGGNEPDLAGLADLIVLPAVGGPTVPEPSTYGLLGLGVLGLIFVARRRK